MQANIPLLLEQCSLQASLNAGFLRTIDPNSKTVTVADKFFLGGPLNLRGFDMRGVGPSSDGNAVGGTAYWAAGLHLYTPLPLRQAKSICIIRQKTVTNSFPATVSRIEFSPS